MKFPTLGTRMSDEEGRKVAAGGVLWRCHDCKARGVFLRHTKAARDIRAATHQHTGPVGVRFKHEGNCPACGTVKVVDAQGHKLPAKAGEGG